MVVRITQLHVLGLAFCLVTFLVTTLTFDAHSQAAEVSKPNVLLILSDDHSVPHVGCYGNENCKRFNITPNLDAFAASGMRLNRCYTSAPQCAPSRISIFAGRSPVGLGVTRFAQPARADVPFFTDILRENGYWVGLDGRHQHLDGRVKESSHVEQTLKELGMQNLGSRFDHFVRHSKTKGEPLGQVAERVSAVLDQVPDGKPFFLYFGFNQPHRPFGEDHENINPDQLTIPVDWPDLPEVRLDYARYLDDVRDLDHGFGLLMKLLEQRGIENETIVIFMGDNGEALLRGKGTLYDRGTHVPCLIRWPAKIKAGWTSNALISGIDFGATILAAAGLAQADKMDGHNFLPLLLGDPSFEERKYVFAERGWHWGPITRTDGLDLSRSITTKRYRLIYNALPDRSYTPVDMSKSRQSKRAAWPAIQAKHRANQLSELHQRLYFQNPRPIVELYDLQEDPLEIQNLAGSGSHQQIEKQLLVELEKWMIREHDYLPLPGHALQNEK